MNAEEKHRVQSMVKSEQIRLPGNRPTCFNGFVKTVFPAGKRLRIAGRLSFLAALLVSAGGTIGLREGSGAAADSPFIYILPIDGEVEKGLSWVVRRGVREAEQAGAEAIVVVINTDGGRADATREIMEYLLRSKVPVYSYIDSRAFSAGAYIAVATRKIYMAPASTIGAATPVAAIPGAGPVAMDPAVEEKITSAFRALIASTAEQQGHPVKIVEAMVDRDVEIEGVIEKGKLLTLTNKQAESEEVGLSQGTVESLEALVARLGFEDARMVLVQTTWAEVLTRFLTQSLITSLLLMGGLAGIYFEIRTPGIGLPGLLGVSCLILFFFGHYIAGLAGYEEIVVFLLGAVMLAIELFVTPGFGLLGGAGIACLLASFISAMGRGPFFSRETFFSPDYFSALANLGLALVGFVLVILFSYRFGFTPASPFYKRIVLTADQAARDGYDVSRPELTGLRNRRGTTLTKLHPAGKARIGDETVDVVSRGEFIEADTPVEVIEATGWRVVVRPVKEERRKTESRIQKTGEGV